MANGDQDVHLDLSSDEHGNPVWTATSTSGQIILYLDKHLQINTGQKYTTHFTGRGINAQGELCFSGIEARHQTHADGKDPITSKGFIARRDFVENEPALTVNILEDDAHMVAIPTFDVPFQVTLESSSLYGALKESADQEREERQQRGHHRDLAESSVGEPAGGKSQQRGSREVDEQGGASGQVQADREGWGDLGHVRSGVDVVVFAPCSESSVEQPDYSCSVNSATPGR
ncbi:hypothetical protein C8J57DRAFT_1230848 [Mycena rebaudengoi]|nr:hypothetical protein C8J57DRAFT_1230848 [Mycena rebaudengoi]